MRRRGELGRGCATRRMPGAVQGVAPVLIPQAIEEGGTLLDLAAPTGPLTKQLPHAMAHCWGSLALVLAYAGLLEGYGTDGDAVELLVRHEREDLHVVEACDGLPIEVGHQLVGTKPCIVSWASLVHSLRGCKGEREREGGRRGVKR